jgi:hypothetical protein
MMLSEGFFNDQKSGCSQSECLIFSHSGKGWRRSEEKLAFEKLTFCLDFLYSNREK